METMENEFGQDDEAFDSPWSLVALVQDSKLN